MTRTLTDLNAVLERAQAVTHSMFRLEVLQSYGVSYEQDAYQAYLRDGTIDLTPGRWQTIVARHVTAGRPCQRVHVVHEPPTPYLRYEMSAPYARSAAAGEEIRILVAAPEHWPAHVPRIDFWLFDHTEAWIMHYDAEGHFLAIEVIQEPLSVSVYRRGAKSAVALATPLAEYTRQALE